MTRDLKSLLRLVLLLALACAIPSLAQQPPVKGGPVPKGPNAPQMKMKSTTNEQRREAAARNAERKLAAGQKNQAIQSSRGKVKK